MTHFPNETGAKEGKELPEVDRSAGEGDGPGLWRAAGPWLGGA